MNWLLQAFKLKHPCKFCRGETWAHKDFCSDDCAYKWLEPVEIKITQYASLVANENPKPDYTYGHLVCPNPRRIVMVGCVVCDHFLVDGKCRNSECYAYVEKK